MLAFFCERTAACAERPFMSKSSREATKSTAGAFLRMARAELLQFFTRQFEKRHVISVKNKLELLITKILARVEEKQAEREDFPLILAIDGKSGSGKTTLAALLSEKTGALVLHMDDFFLRPEQRTDKRLKEIGGNVDYERFSAVLSQVKAKEEVQYQPYDCKTGTLQEIQIFKPEKIVIVEGSYSMNSYFGDYADIKVGMDIDAERQKERILKRNGQMMLARFLEEWIPKENVYLEEFKIFEKCDFRISV